MVKTGQAITVCFTTANASTGAAADGDSTPTGTLYVNGTADAATVTVTKITTGVYKAALTLPTLTAGDVVSLRIAATVATVAGEGVVFQDIADTKRTSDLQFRKNTALAGFMLLMTDSTNHAPATGLTVTGTRSLDGAAFAGCANSVTEVAYGWYKIDLAAGDLNGNVVALRFTATGADDLNMTVVTQG